MPEYRVTWEIDVDAESPVDAAKMAKEVQLDKDSIATVFIVERLNDKGRPHINGKHVIDLNEIVPVTED